MVAGLAVIAIVAACIGGFLASGYGIAAMLAAAFLAGSGLPALIVAARLQAWRGDGRVPAPASAIFRQG